MEPIFKVPASPGTPLYPISPERTNRQSAIPVSSPSLTHGFAAASRGLHDPFGSPGRLSDVQGKVAQFNNLSRESTQKRMDMDAALKRAVVGREEAEAELKRLREAYTELRAQVEEFGERERKIGLRIEATMVCFFLISFIRVLAYVL
jgi:septal ring factor EnvC (AmiA/AmiB activator)